MYLGVPIRAKSYMFGNNKSVPTSTISKKSTLASYHRVREAIAAGYLQFNWKDGKSNPADTLSKHWEFASIWTLLKPLLFRKGDTSELTTKTKGSDRILPYKVGLCLSLMDQGLIPNLNVTLRGYPKKFWGLFGSSHNTTNLLIGQFAKMDSSHWSRCTLQYLNQFFLTEKVNDC